MNPIVCVMAARQGGETQLWTGTCAGNPAAEAARLERRFGMPFAVIGWKETAEPRETARKLEECCSGMGIGEAQDGLRRIPEALQAAGRHWTRLLEILREAPETGRGTTSMIWALLIQDRWGQQAVAPGCGTEEQLEEAVRGACEGETCIILGSRRARDPEEALRKLRQICSRHFEPAEMHGNADIWSVQHPGLEALRRFLAEPEGDLQ